MPASVKLPVTDIHVSASEKPPVTYILPTIAWASLLEIIAKDAPPGAVIEVHTAEMQRVAEQVLQRFERTDVLVRFLPQKFQR